MVLNMEIDAKLTLNNSSFLAESGETVISQYGCQPLIVNQIYPTLACRVGLNFFQDVRAISLFCAPFALFLLLSPCAHGQRDTRKLKRAGVVQLNDTVSSYGQSDIFRFPNLNKTYLYADEPAAREIERLNKSG